jgi:predicted  nucleic acid-binding Zn-ribbon protein
MSTKTLIIKEITRSLAVEDDETLTFEPGVNVIVGRPNTGKTKWLQMIDYLMGDPGKPEDTFDTDIAEKYDSARAVFEIEGEELVVERNWKKYGMKSKVLVNEEAIPATEFSSFLLSKLEIPILNFPSGSPYRGKWKSLSWRTLLRHIYRQQRFWGDFADKQPESEQLACLFQFLGIAENLFSDKYGQLVEKRKKIFQLEGAKEAFIDMLNQISKELIGEKEVQVGVTAQSIDVAIDRLQTQIKQQQSVRDETLKELLNEAVKIDGNRHTANQFDNLGERWANLQSQREKSLVRLNTIQNRIQELQEYKDSVDNELSKINRAKVAGKVFADLKITHCPACDQSVEMPDSITDTCFLCKRPIEHDQNELEEGSVKRIDFEIEHLKIETQEVNELLSETENEYEEALNRHRMIEEDIRLAESQLYSIRRASASILPPEIAVLDQNIGQMQERVRQLERMKSALDLREALSREIDELQKEVTELENEVNELSQKINYEKASDKLSDGMTTYLNSLVAQNQQLWTQGRINWKLRERGFNVTIANSKWSTKLGGTLLLYFLLAYHYALLNLTSDSDCHYPGLIILDLPAKLEDGSTVKDQENFILEPFVRLIQITGMQNTQVIVTGDSFEQLENANRIELDRVWK